jgi:hypothetical protein
MNQKTIYVLVLLGIILIIWFLYSWLSVRNIEEPKYEVVSVADGYEIREYKSYIIAETTITGSKDRNEAVNKGFPIVAGYIFGDNTTKAKIAMTVPVNTSQDDSQKIAMTVPVNTERGENDVYKISFVLPSEYTLNTLPVPNNSRVVIREVPSRKVAVKRFTWFANESRLQDKESALLSELKRDDVKVVGAVNIARYNPPWTMPFMLRNEVQVEIGQ